MWMNRCEVEEARDRYQNDPVLGPATRYLYDLMEETNEHSDGWHSWPAPAKAAEKLMVLIHAQLRSGMGAYPQAPKPTMADVRKALTPILSFYTKRGLAAGMTIPKLA